MKYLISITFVLAMMTPPVAHGRVFMDQQHALSTAFAPGTTVRRETVFLTDAQLQTARRLSGSDFEDKLVIRYAGVKDGKVIGWAYFDAHRVRTLPETIMVLVTPDGKISRVDILSFNEPMDYLPKERWLEQLDGHSLDDELALDRAIRPISGASLSGRAIVRASRKILAIHHAIEGNRPASQGAR
ncbi:MAG: FMN-binding protein [Thermoanaerobaculia bacterium]